MHIKASLLEGFLLISIINESLETSSEINKVKCWSTLQCSRGNMKATGVEANIYLAQCERE